MKARIKHGVFLTFALLAVILILDGCMVKQSGEKIRDLEFTITKTEELPEDLQKMLEEKKEENFSFTYSDNEYLYIAKGYGIQETGGYSVSVDDCYLTKTNIVVKTRLHGPAVGEDVAKTPSYPNIVLKMELCDREVIFG